LAAFIASILIILYIWWRFKAVSGLSAGVSGVIALFHDALVMLAVYTIFNIPLNESFIAAVLTILGYSMNDTVIIFDRIRENNRLLRKVPIPELVNKSIMQTLNRTINTSVTVMMSVIIVYGFAFYYGIESVKEFTFPLMIGLLSGTYSSIFIACPLFVMWKERSAKKAASAKPAKA
jgi:preprotein translocase subunit SecF